MRQVMQKSAMAFTALFVALSGLLVAGSHLNYFIIVLIIVILLWAAVEAFIGFSRPVEGIGPSHPLISISRMLWPLFALYSWLDLRNRWTIVQLPDWLTILLLALCLGALALRTWAVLHLGRSFTYDVKKPAGNVLVRTGPYRLIRHPGYFGIILLATLPGLILGSVVGFVGLSLATLVQTLMRLHAEDRMLEDIFGAAFREYERKTARLLPYVY